MVDCSDLVTQPPSPSPLATTPPQPQASPPPPSVAPQQHNVNNGQAIAIVPPFLLCTFEATSRRSSSGSPESESAPAAILIHAQYDVPEPPPEMSDTSLSVERSSAGDVGGDEAAEQWVLRGHGLGVRVGVVAWLEAIERLRTSEAGLPCTVRLVLDGQGEAGNPLLSCMLRAYADKELLQGITEVVTVNGRWPQPTQPALVTARHGLAVRTRNQHPTILQATTTCMVEHRQECAGILFALHHWCECGRRYSLPRFRRSPLTPTLPPMRCARH